MAFNPVGRILYDKSKNRVQGRFFAVHVAEHWGQPEVYNVEQTNDPANYVKGKGLTNEGKWLQGKTVFDAGEEVIAFDVNKVVAERKALKRFYATLHNQ